MRAHAGADTSAVEHDLGAAADAAGRAVGGPSAWQRWAARVPVRLDPGRRAAVGVGCAVAVAALVTGIWLTAQRPRAVAVSAGVPSATGASNSPSGSAPARSPTAAARSASAEVVVDVAGRVRHPGLYRLPAGSRIDDALRRAGGALAGVDLTSLNLAARLVDGQQIVVGVRGTLPGGAGAGGAAAGGTAAPGAGTLVNLNSASLEQLDALPGVGPVLAQHILDWRAQHGQFTAVGQLQEVSGIGPAKFAAIKNLVTT
jgi:competence protein ComEA